MPYPLVTGKAGTACAGVGFARSCRHSAGALVHLARFTYSSRVQRPIWYRVLIAVWGLWFVTALSDVGGVHSCPMHGNHAAHVGHAVALSNGHAGGAHQTQSAANGHHGAPSSPTDHSKTTCTCFGSCCGATAINVPAQPAALPVEVIVDVDVALHRDATTTGLRRAYAHPFANGPPVAPTL
jgi:hypothetical protein